MARADRRRTGRSPAPARPRSEYAAIEDQLFFTRLRTHAKIGFVFLALVFGVGFVAFGVGSEFGGGIADVFQGGSAQGQVSVEDARARVQRNPRDADALRELNIALQREGRTEEAIRALERYMRVRPGDADVQRELASLYVAKATKLRNEAAQAQAEGQLLASPAVTSEDDRLGQALGGGEIRDTLSNEAQQRLSEKYIAMQEAYGEARRAYSRLAELTPQDASVQLQLADAALNAQDVQAALAAYRRFLQLAPDDPSAPLIRQEVQRLEKELGPAGG